MTGDVIVHGIVLKSMPVGDYDRRVTILTSERGRITAFAKGARRPTGAFLACSQGFTYGEFALFEGHDAYTIKNVTNAHYFEELRKDLDGACYGMYFCELAAYLTSENLEEPGQMKLLYLSLLALTKPVFDKRLVRCIYELRALSMFGEGIRREGLNYSGKYNGLVAAPSSDSFPVSESTLYTVSFILSEPLKTLFSFKVTDEVLLELEKITRDYVTRHVDREMKTLEVLGTLS